MSYLATPLLEIKEYKHILESIKSRVHVNISGPADSQKVHMSFAICEHLKCKGVFIAYNDMQARKAYEDFVFFASEDVLYFPSKEIMLHDIEAKSNDAVFQRVHTLDRLINGDYLFLVTSAEALSHMLVSRELFTEYILEFQLGTKIDLIDLAEKLVIMGYERVSNVEGKGQFAVRGGIVDIFPVNIENSVRIELFDDEIDSIRKIDISTQRSSDKLKSIRIIPAREIIYKPAKRDDIVKHIEDDIEELIKKTPIKNQKEHIKEIKAKIGSDLEKIKSEYYFAGMDKYIPYIIEKKVNIFDYISDDNIPEKSSRDCNKYIVFADEPVRLKQRVEVLVTEHNELCKGLLEKGHILPNSFNMFFDYESLINSLANKRTVYLNTISVGNAEMKSSTVYSLPARSSGSYSGHIELLLEEIKSWKERKSRVIILAGTGGRGGRLAETLVSKGIEAVYVEKINEQVLPGQVLITHGSLNKGFEYPSIGLTIVSDKELFGEDKRQKRLNRKKKGSKINLFTDLNLSDYVVHQSHGIGQYVGIQTLAVDNVKRDYIKIRYHDNDHLYIPTNQLDLIQKYIGSDAKAPKLNRLGGTDWVKTKKRVKESLRELAEELVKLYAQRQAQEGFAFTSDTVWQGQLEEQFPYEETEDQLQCVEEIKADMESKRPMDRLLCGDVGYGKTEVAIRAIFKAIMDGKQVAYLVPTTILASQHFSNFKERMKEFPVTVDVISRFRTQSEQKKILKDVKSGNVDVLIGTHRLIQKDIQFKDLGLLVIDEEQRFGVTHKEKLKNLKPNVDVLTLTATPIPRTLHMSLVGIRDISVIEDPPEERYPVQTYVMEYNSDLIREAINREISRDGQVFYLYNRVQSIHKKASELQILVPDAKVAVAHGQMDEGELEDMMFAFIKGEYNVLVCTTIIESGLDMPNVNTIIVEDSDKMGLAQLYQLRGRVGRSNRLAHAYITYRKDKVLSEIAEKRLQAIKEFTEFGSGFKIAMRDLEIRGAGNLLGSEQHGHMESVGYDMYCRLLDEAVRELKGEEDVKESAEISIDINVNAYINDEYISIESHKIEMYKKIASAMSEKDISEIEDELVDRFGDLTLPVKNLIQIARLKNLAVKCGISSIQEKNSTIILQYKNNALVKLDVLGKLMEKFKRKLLFTASNTPYLTYKIPDEVRAKLLENIKILLQSIYDLQCS